MAHTSISKRVLQEPLLHFLVLGVLIYAGVRYFAPPPHQYRIVVGPEQTRQLAARFALQYGEPPTAHQLNTLVDRHVDEEILYREGIALGLERDDEIVRRRIVQKVQFLQQDVEAAPEPTAAELQAFYSKHQARYAIPERATFTHIYFSPDNGGDTAARERAVEQLRALTPDPKAPTRAPERGDRFPDLYDYASLGQIELARLFGRTELSSAVLKASVNQWSGPFRSGYGWHLVYVSEHETARVPVLAEVADRVKADFVHSARESRNEATFAKLASKYEVLRQTDALEARTTASPQHSATTAAALRQ